MRQDEGLPAAAARLTDRYPALSPGVATQLLSEALATVHSKIGRYDLALAEDLAELRLQVRLRAGRL